MEERHGLRLAARHFLLRDAVWIVAFTDSFLMRRVPRAALSYVDAPQEKRCYAYDLYTNGTTTGIKAGLFCVQFLLYRTDEMEYEIVGETDSVNTEYRSVLSRFGFQEYAVSFIRRPQERRK